MFSTKHQQLSLSLSLDNPIAVLSYPIPHLVQYLGSFEELNTGWGRGHEQVS